MLRVRQVGELRLTVNVSNERDGEEAHEAMAYIEMPPSLEYLGTDERVSVQSAFWKPRILPVLLYGSCAIFFF